MNRSEEQHQKLQAEKDDLEDAIELLRIALMARMYTWEDPYLGMNARMWESKTEALLRRQMIFKTRLSEYK